MGKAAELAGDTLEKAMQGVAAAEDAAVDAVQKPFTEVGRDIVIAKHDDILNVYLKYINDLKVKDAVKLVRGDVGNAISINLLTDMVRDLAKLLLPIVQEEIDKHAVTKAWDLAIENSNKILKAVDEALDKMGDVGDMLDPYIPDKISL